ncbi:MAG: polyhydroxyalkanoic acid system family protein [Planctomycetaceae bacterium]|jgi:hypothetical protein|nr:polyhydroxyalkanoic acid system family protein [Planctomycetaceae bacterium]
MPQLSVTVPHSLSQDEAVSRLNKKLEQIKAENLYEVRDLVEDRPDTYTLRFSFKVLGFGVSGECFTKPDDVTINVELPVAAIVIKQMIQTQLTRELTTVLT